MKPRGELLLFPRRKLPQHRDPSFGPIGFGQVNVQRNNPVLKFSIENWNAICDFMEGIVVGIEIGVLLRNECL